MAQAIAADSGLEPQEHGFRLQLDAELRKHSRLDLIFQRHNVGRRGASAIHDRQRVPSGNPGRASVVAFGEARAFNQPCRGKFAKSLTSRIAR